MEHNNNESIDPRCLLQQPPLAADILKELDAYGVALYAILTIMASLSMLVFIDGAIYVYRKVEYPKKTAIIWINGAAPVIATMCCLGMWIPRATMFADMTSGSYFSIVVYQFLLLLIAECGGDEGFLRRFRNTRLKISTGPCCCCCPCLPTAPITWRTLFLLKLTSFQFALMKPVLTIISIVLWTNGNFDPSDYGITGAVVWIGPLLGVLTILALWPGVMTFMHLYKTLSSQNIIPKYAMYQVRQQHLRLHTHTHTQVSMVCVRGSWLPCQYHSFPSLLNDLCHKPFSFLSWCSYSVSCKRSSSMS
uniref:Solute carrier family 51 member A n=1 Tax=Scleropages formosus TaxID=113540 RepID=A0A8C9RWI6_SCLFO